MSASSFCVDSNWFIREHGWEFIIVIQTLRNTISVLLLQRNQAFKKLDCVMWKVIEQRFNFQPPSNQDHMQTPPGVEILTALTLKGCPCEGFQRHVTKCNSSRNEHRLSAKTSIIHTLAVCKKTDQSKNGLHCEQQCTHLGWLGMLMWDIWDTNNIFRFGNMSFLLKTN